VVHLFYSELNTIKILPGQKTIINLNKPKNHIISHWVKIGSYLNGLPHQMLPRQTTMSYTATSVTSNHHVIHCHINLADVVDAATSDERAAGNRICDG
jgi:hypothetical protein